MASVACKRLLSAALGKSVRGVTGADYGQWPVRDGGFTSTVANATVEVKRLGDKGMLPIACFQACSSCTELATDICARKQTVPMSTALRSRRMGLSSLPAAENGGNQIIVFGCGMWRAGLRSRSLRGTGEVGRSI